MSELTIEQVELISNDIRQQQIDYSHLFDDLLDHLCCDTEDEMRKGKAFQTAYDLVKEKIGINGLKDIQDNTEFYVKLNLLAMKKLMRICGIVSSVLIAVSLVFKLQHWPGSNILFFLGFLVMFLLFFPLAYFSISKEKNLSFLSGQSIRYIVGFIILIETGAAILFSSMYWPGNEVLVVISMVLVLFVLFPILLFSAARMEENRILLMSLTLFAYLFVAISTIQAYNRKTSARNLFNYTEFGMDQEIEFYKARSEALYLEIIAEQSGEQISDLLGQLNKEKTEVETQIEKIISVLLYNNTTDITSLNFSFVKNSVMHDDFYPMLKPLKEAIDSYRSSAIELLDDDAVLNQYVSMKLNTGSESVKPIKNWPWEKQNFYGYPFRTSAYNSLSRMQRDLCQVHYEVLMHLDQKKQIE